MKAKSTESQATGIDTKRIRQDILKLRHNQDEKKRKRDRRDNLFNGGFLIFLAILTIIGILLGNWGGVLFNLSISIWVALNWMKDKTINNLRYVTDMQFGLRDLEQRELEIAMKGKK